MGKTTRPPGRRAAQNRARKENKRATKDTEKAEKEQALREDEGSAAETGHNLKMQSEAEDSEVE